MKLYTKDIENTLIQQLQQGAESLDFSLYHGPLKKVNNTSTISGNSKGALLVTLPNEFEITARTDGAIITWNKGREVSRSSWTKYECYGDSSVGSRTIQWLYTLENTHTAPITDFKYVNHWGENWLVSASQDKTLKVWDLQTHRCLQTVSTSEIIEYLERSPQTQLFARTAVRQNYYTYGIQVWELKPALAYQDIASVLNVVATTPNNLKMLSLKTIKLGEIGFKAILGLLQTHAHLEQLVIAECGLTVAQEQELKQALIDAQERRKPKIEVFNIHSQPPLMDKNLHEHTHGGQAVMLSQGRVVKAKEENIVHKQVYTQAIEDALIQQLQQGLKSLDFSLYYAPAKMLKNIKVHSGFVYGLTVLPNGLVISASEDKTFRVCEPETGQCLQTFIGHTNTVYNTAVLPNGQVISASSDNTLKVWDPYTGGCLRSLTGHLSTVFDVAVLPNGHVVSVSDDNTLKFWEPYTGRCLRSLTGYSSSVAVLPNGQVISGSFDGTLKVWNPETGQCLQTLAGHSHGVKCVAALPNEHVVSGSDDATLKVWNHQTGQCLRTLTGHSSTVFSVAVLPSGQVVSASGDNTLKVWDPHTGQCLQTLAGYSDREFSVSVLPNGQVVSGSREGNLKIWDLTSFLTYRDIKRFLAAVSLPGNTLRELFLENVQLDDAGFVCVLNLIQNHQHLEVLNLAHTGLTSHQELILQEALTTRQQKTGHLITVDIFPDLWPFIPKKAVFSTFENNLEHGGASSYRTPTLSNKDNLVLGYGFSQGKPRGVVYNNNLHLDEKNMPTPEKTKNPMPLYSTDVKLASTTIPDSQSLLPWDKKCEEFQKKATHNPTEKVDLSQKHLFEQADQDLWAAIILQQQDILTKIQNKNNVDTPDPRHEKEYPSWYKEQDKLTMLPSHSKLEQHSTGDLFKDVPKQEEKKPPFLIKSTLFPQPLSQPITPQPTSSISQPVLSKPEVKPQSSGRSLAIQGLIDRYKQNASNPLSSNHSSPLPVQKTIVLPQQSSPTSPILSPVSPLSLVSTTILGPQPLFQSDRKCKEYQKKGDQLLLEKIDLSRKQEAEDQWGATTLQQHDVLTNIKNKNNVETTVQGSEKAAQENTKQEQLLSSSDNKSNSVASPKEKLKLDLAPSPHVSSVLTSSNPPHVALAPLLIQSTQSINLIPSPPLNVTLATTPAPQPIPEPHQPIPQPKSPEPKVQVGRGSEGASSSKILYSLGIQNKMLSELTDNQLKRLDFSIFHAPASVLKNLEGHTAEVNAVSLLSCGWLISASCDTTLKIWNPETGVCLQTLAGHSGYVHCVAVLPNGHIVSGSGDNTLKVWNPETGECLQTLKGHSDFVRGVTVLQNGQILSASQDTTLKVWNPETGFCLKTLSGHSGYVTAVAVLPNGQLISGSYDTTLKIWNPETGQCLQTLMGHSSLVFTVAVLPNGHIVSGSGDNTLKVWNPETGECLQTVIGHSKEVYSVAVLWNGQIVSGSADGSLKIWNSETGQCLQTLLGHSKEVYAVAVLQNGQIVSSGNECTLKVWDLYPDLTYQDVAPILAVVSTPGNTLHEFSLKGVQLGPDGFEDLLRLVQNHRYLQRLELSEGGLTFAQKSRLQAVLVKAQKNMDHTIKVDIHPLEFDALRIKAEQGDAVAQFSLGFMYQNGKGVEKDEVKAREWYHQAAEQENTNAQYSLGYMYQKGIGGSKNVDDAIKWYGKAAKQENANAQYSLGFMHENGIGTSKNKPEAVKWYSKAADQKHEKAMDALSRLQPPVIPIPAVDTSAAIREKIFAVAANRENPTWVVLTAYYGYDAQACKKELVSLQTELRENLVEQLRENHGHFYDAIKAAEARGLIDKKTAEIYKKINTAANGAKHGNMPHLPSPKNPFASRGGKVPVKDGHAKVHDEKKKDGRKPYKFKDVSPSRENNPSTFMSSGVLKSSRHWYKDDEINSLFNQIQQTNQHVHVLDAMLGTDWFGEEGKENTLRENLVAFNLQRTLAISNHQETTANVLIPVNLNLNHWVLFHISYPRDVGQLGQQPTIYYFDPMGQPIPGDGLQALRDAFRSPQLQVTSIGQRVQKDGFNCGPWIVLAAEMLITQGRVPGVDEVNIQEVRERQQQLLNQIQAPKNLQDPVAPRQAGVFPAPRGGKSQNPPSNNNNQPNKNFWRSKFG